MTSNANDRLRICPSNSFFDAPFDSRERMANGIDKPTMKRKAGNTVSANPNRSSPSFACSSHLGTFSTNSRSLTKIISSIVMARNTSMEASRRGREIVISLIFPIIKPVDHSTRIPILVVKPGYDLHEPAYGRRQRTINHTGMRISLNIERYQGIFIVINYPSVFFPGRLSEQVIDLLRFSFCPKRYRKVRHCSVGNRYPCRDRSDPAPDTRQQSFQRGSKIDLHRDDRLRRRTTPPQLPVRRIDQLLSRSIGMKDIDLNGFDSQRTQN